MSDLKLNSENDLLLTDDGRLELHTDLAPTVRQRLLIRLRTWLGEWFLDQNIGMPYLRDFLVKNPDFTVIRSVLRRAALATPGIERVVSLRLDERSDLRRLGVDITVQLTDGVTLTINDAVFLVAETN